MTDTGKRVLALTIAVLLGLAGLGAPTATAAGTGTISGTVTVASSGNPAPSTQAQVQVLQGSTWTVVHNAYTDGYGRYTSEPLAPGTYRVEFSNLDYRTQVSAPVSVTEGATTAVDAVLDRGAQISGRFTVPDGGPAADGSVRVYEQLSSGHWAQVDHTLVTPHGTYTVSGLAGGRYKVQFGDFKRHYASEFYNNVATLEQAQVLDVPPGGSVGGIDVTLSTEALPVPQPPAQPTPPMTHVSVDRAPRVGGVMRVGERVRATIGTVTPASATVSYAWFQDGRKIKKATTRRLRLTPAMLGHRVGVRVTVTAPGLERWRSVSMAKVVRPAR